MQALLWSGVMTTDITGTYVALTKNKIMYIMSVANIKQLLNYLLYVLEVNDHILSAIAFYLSPVVKKS